MIEGIHRLFRKTPAYCVYCGDITSHPLLEICPRCRYKLSQMYSYTITTKIEPFVLNLLEE